MLFVSEMETSVTSSRAPVNHPRLQLQRPLPFANYLRLVQLLFAKSVIEIIFIVILVVSFTYTTLNPHFRGSLDEANSAHVSGWAVDESIPAAHVEVQLYIDGHLAGSRAADTFRPDVFAKRRAQDEYHGFVFETPPLAVGEHEARVYFMHESAGGLRRTLQLVGKPLRFTAEATQPNVSAKEH